MKKPKKIGLWIYTEEVRIFVMTRRKRKLTELYPQRAILEEQRKESSLIQANDWIDHNYYENMVEKSEEQIKEMDKKYGVNLPDKDSRPTKKMPSYGVPTIPEFPRRIQVDE